MGNAHVIGFGHSGIAAAKLLREDGWRVCLSDRQGQNRHGAHRDLLEQLGVSLRLGQDPQWDEPTDLVVVSPGVPWDAPALTEARALGIEVIGELELAGRYLGQFPWVVITGTNGKTTTTALVEAIFQAAGLTAPACGNIGRAASELALENFGSHDFPSRKGLDWVIAEVSSYQAEAAFSIKPQIGIWTTLTPDHLNRHKTLENYARIKAELLQACQDQVLNGDDPYLRSHFLNDQWPRAVWVTCQDPQGLGLDRDRLVYLEDAWVKAFGELIMPVNLFKMFGAHNRQNLLMAIAVARLAGIEKQAIIEAMSSFTGVPHRLEWVRQIQGVDYLNDSKATNYDAAEVGLAAVPGPVILIAGGEAKTGEAQAWLGKIQEKVAKVLLIGEATAEFAEKLTAVGYGHHESLETMAAAVQRAQAIAPELGAKTVLLSPACASFDQYHSFEERGDDFRALVLGIEEN